MTQSNEFAPEETETIDMIAEVIWNGEGAPEVSDEEYKAKYVKDAEAQYRDYKTGNFEPWWWEGANDDIDQLVDESHRQERGD